VTHTLLISIIPVILFGSSIYYMGSWIVKKEIYRASQESLIQIQHQVETKLNNIEQTASQISMQSNIIELMNIGTEPGLGTISQSNKVLGDLMMVKSAAKEVLSIYFYHIEQQVLITNDTITSIDEKRVAKDTGWLEDVEGMVRSRKQRMWVIPRLMNVESGPPIPTLSHITLLPLFYNKPKGALVINLHADFLEKAISRFPLNAEGQLVIIGKEGELIARTPPGGQEKPTLAQLTAFLAGRSEGNGVHTGTIGGSFVSVVRSGMNGWSYAMIIPSGTPRQQVELFKNVIILITVLLCVLAVYSAYFSHKRFQNIMKRIMDKLSLVKSAEVHPDGGEELLSIEKRINSLLEEAVNGNSLKEKHFPLLRTHYLHSCIHGNVVEMNRLSEQQKEWELFKYSRFCVMAIQMDDESSSSFDKDHALFLFAVSNLADELTTLHEGEWHLQLEPIIVNPYTVVIVNYNGEEVTEERLLSYADELRGLVAKILKHTVTIGVGTPVSSVRRLVHSYREALDALDMNGANVYDEVLSYRNMRQDARKLVQYPALEEQEFMRSLRARDGEAARDALTDFRRKLEGEQASLHLIKTFYLQLLVAVISFVQEYNEDTEQVFRENNPYEVFFPMKSPAVIHQWFEGELLGLILAYMESVKRNKNDVLIRKTLDLIQEKYKTDLTLQAAADAANISPSYLSKLFKEEVGESFVEYVTGLRLEHAVRLLQETDWTLTQISEEIGYTSVQQLFRIFRKKYGITPGEYRENLHSANEKDFS
jgi:YesN/AraC family two-component response regulator/predicted regulator of Ras-like GTPase activity (Roadblock/LC7/MglB family)